MGDNSETQSLTNPAEEGVSTSGWSRKRVILAIITGFVIVALAVGLITVFIVLWSDQDGQPESSQNAPLSSLVTVPNILTHLQNFEKIALGVGGGSRAVMTGYEASAAYVIKTLTENTNCNITIQNFTVPIYNQNSSPTLSLVQPYSLNFVLNSDFIGTRYGGNGTYNLQEAVQFVGDACSINPNFTPGLIALAQNGNCTQYDKALNAENMGASAILIVNSQGSSLANWRVRAVEWNISSPQVQIPVLSISWTLGNILLSVTNPVLALTLDTSVVLTETFNVFCETKAGSAQKTMVVGSHLDGVPEGPGINDNGSGSATVLEIAIQVHKSSLPIENKILFAWWGAEEIGLLGSRYFVNDLVANPNPSRTVLLDLNFDMLASPNYNRQIGNGNSTFGTSRNGSVAIHKLFQQGFEERNLTYQFVGLTGGSDFFPFTEAGFPAGALMTGAGGIKQVSEVELFGGIANTAYDPCYHQYCDLVTNINQQGLGEMSQVAADVIATLATHPNLPQFLNPQ